MLFSLYVFYINSNHKSTQEMNSAAVMSNHGATILTKYFYCNMLQYSYTSGLYFSVF